MTAFAKGPSAALLRRGTALALLAVLAACGNDAASAGQEAAPPKAVATVQAAAATASAVPAQKLSESDRLALEMAEAGCRNNDFKQFFQFFTNSEAVQRKYTAAKVEFGTSGQAYQMPAERYHRDHHFPLAIIDYYWMTRESGMLYEMGDPTANDKVRYVELTFETANDNRQRVDWIPGIFEKNLGRNLEDLGDGVGKLVEPTGPGGYLLFFPTKTCWELVSDVANPRTVN